MLLAVNAFGVTDHVTTRLQIQSWRVNRACLSVYLHPV